MSRLFKPFGGIVAVFLLLFAALYAYREMRLASGLTPEGYPILTPMPGAASFEPRPLPQTPVLKNQSVQNLTVAFGYKVGNIPYSYTLDLHPPGADDTGRATLSVWHSPRNASAESAVVWRWDEPRKAYAVALQEKFDIQPAVPTLCVKAVIGPRPNLTICGMARSASRNAMRQAPAAPRPWLVGLFARSFSRMSSFGDAFTWRLR